MIVFGFTSNAQVTGFFSGLIKDSITQQPISYTSISNLTTGKTVIANKGGFFKIEAKQGHLISIIAAEYKFDTLFLNAARLAKDTFVVFLPPLTHELEGVTVKSKYNPYQVDSIERKTSFDIINGKPKSQFDIANSGAGLGISLDYLSSHEKKKRRSLDIFEQMEQEAYIDYRFNVKTVSKYVTLSEDSLLLFIQQYRPTYEWVRKHTREEDILYYVNDKIKGFLRRKKAINY